MNKAEELIEKYKLVPDHYYDLPAYPIDFSPYKEIREDDNYEGLLRLKKLKERFGKRVPPRWYGFDGLGIPTPIIWYDVLAEFLEYVEQQCPDFEIYQIKIKFGGIRIYLGNITNDVQQEIFELTSAMVDAKLVY